MIFKLQSFEAFFIIFIKHKTLVLLVEQYPCSQYILEYQNSIERFLWYVRYQHISTKLNLAIGQQVCRKSCHPCFEAQDKAVVIVCFFFFHQQGEQARQCILLKQTKSIRISKSKHMSKSSHQFFFSKLSLLYEIFFQIIFFIN